MSNKIKLFQALRRRKAHGKPDCPICKVPMKRKGKKGWEEYFKCLKCKGKMSRGLFVPCSNPDTQDIRTHQIREFRRELSIRKLIVKLKKQKYLGYDSFEIEGRMINLNDFDVDGISFEEKRKIEEERKKQEEKAKKAKKKKKTKKKTKVVKK